MCNTLNIWHKVCPIPKQNVSIIIFLDAERNWTILFRLNDVHDAINSYLHLIPILFRFTYRVPRIHSAQKPKMTETDARITFSWFLWHSIYYIKFLDEWNRMMICEYWFSFAISICDILMVEWWMAAWLVGTKFKRMLSDQWRIEIIFYIPKWQCNVDVDISV